MDLVTLAALADEAHKNHLKVLTHTVTVFRGKEASKAKSTWSPTACRTPRSTRRRRPVQGQRHGLRADAGGL